MMHHPGQQAREEKPSAPTQDTYSYISNYLWKSTTPAEPEKRVVVSYAFDKYDYKDFETRNCLIITYENGFHVWDIEDTKNIFEICSIKSEQTKKKYFYSKILPTPFNEVKGQANHIFSTTRPVLLSYDGEGFLSWTSLSTKDEQSRKSHQKISGIDANRYAICIGFESAVCVLSSLTLQQLGTYDCCPNDFSRFALGSRWLALTTKQTSVDSSLTDINFNDLNYSTLEVAKDLGNKFFSSIYSLTDITTKTVTGIVTGESGLGVSSLGASISANNQNPGPPNEDPQASQLNQSAVSSANGAALDASAGIIGLVDITNCTPGHFLTFRADNQPVSKLIFSPSGDLLCCTANSGKSLNIFQIVVTREANGRKKYQVRHLYHLYRGSTSAEITSIDFSCDSNWLTVCSSHGTAHLFAINPSGGEVDKYTHGIGDFPSRPASVKSASGSVHENQPKLIKLTAVNRIKSPTPTKSIASFYLPDKSRKLLTFNPQNGVLTLYELKSPPETPKEAASSQLVIEIVPKSEWHLIRKDSWNNFMFTTPANLMPSPQNAKAASNFASAGEIVTFFSNYFNPIPNRSVFALKIPKTVDNEILFQSVQVIPSSSVPKQNPKQLNKMPIPIASPNLAATVDTSVISKKMEEALADPPSLPNANRESRAQPIPLNIEPVRERKPEIFSPVGPRGFFDEDQGPYGAPN